MPSNLQGHPRSPGAAPCAAELAEGRTPTSPVQIQCLFQTCAEALVKSHATLLAWRMLPQGQPLHGLGERMKCKIPVRDLEGRAGSPLDNDALAACSRATAPGCAQGKQRKPMSWECPMDMGTLMIWDVINNSRAHSSLGSTSLR